ncbi:ATP-grasp domain-containing protein [Betaproteobacteria bacterium]|nr:ATP-grasp domain-containing protein [Betaproteobacteria bacterium]
MLNLLIFESITANLKNIKKLPKLLSQKEFESMKMQGEAMLDALYSDLKHIKQLNITIGKQKFGETALDFFSEVIPKIDLVWVIAPESDGELERFHIASQKKLWIGSGLHAIRLTSNKLETKKYLKSLGISTPDEITLKSLRKNNYIKAVRKPLDGAGTTDTYIIENEKNIIHTLYKKQSYFFLEEWVEGTAYSVSLNCRLSGFDILSINKQHITVNHLGKLIYTGVEPVESKLFKRLRENILPTLHLIVVNISDLRGFIGVDFILNENSQISIIEINPRLTCSYIGLSKYNRDNTAVKILNSFEIKDLV